MATKKTDAVEKSINVTLNVKQIKVRIVGVSPLIVSRFDEKSKQQIEESGKAEKGLKQGGKKKAIADPETQYQNSLYRLSDGSFGMPAVSFKCAMVTAAYRTYGRPMTVTRSAFHVIADDPATGLVKIEGTPQMREDMVRVGGIQKVASPRYRACFPVWATTLTIQFLADVISEEELVGICNASGFTCGVGEWRPEKSNSGSFGLYQVVNNE